MRIGKEEDGGKNEKLKLVNYEDGDMVEDENNVSSNKKFKQVIGVLNLEHEANSIVRPLEYDGSPTQHISAAANGQADREP